MYEYVKRDVGGVEQRGKAGESGSGCSATCLLILLIL